MITTVNLTEEILAEWKTQESKASHTCHYQWNKLQDAINGFKNTSIKCFVPVVHMCTQKALLFLGHNNVTEYLMISRKIASNCGQPSLAKDRSDAQEI